MVAAALLTWWAAIGDDPPPLERYVVAARPIGPGERLTADHLTLSAVDLGPSLSLTAFTDPESMIDAVAAGPIGKGELIQTTALDLDGNPEPERELTFEVTSTWAAGGKLRPGDRIDVYATYGEGTSSQTRRVLTDVKVRRAEPITSDRMGDTGQHSVTVGLRADVPVALVVNAVQSAEITLARVSGKPTTPPSGDGHDRFDADAELSTDASDGEQLPAGGNP